MRRLLLDVNLILDVLLNSQQQEEAESAVWAGVEMGDENGLL